MQWAPLADRPMVVGRRHAVSCGHHLGAQAALDILNAGGNAVDAGVAAGICSGVVESEFVSFAGVAPLMIYVAEQGDVITINGVGVWPQLANADFFRQQYNGRIPSGILRSVVPAAPDAWITALKLYGTMSFGEVASAAIAMAREGFPMYDFLFERLIANQETINRWPTLAAVYAPSGHVPTVGQLFRQPELGGTLQYMVDEERSAVGRGHSRSGGLDAAVDAFYRGDIARSIADYARKEGGWLREADFSNYKSRVESAVSRTISGTEIYSCGPWSQGPMLLQELGLLSKFDLRGMGHNSAEYIHSVVESIKLAAADRDAYYGDPDFVDVPLDRLLSEDYLERRCRDIRHDEAWPEQPPPGLRAPTALVSGIDHDSVGERRSGSDTSYIAVVDKDGNAFSATPSDGSMDDPIVPGTGLVISPRGSCSWVDPGHPCSIKPGKRPRLTPNPAIAIRRGHFVLPFGTPGGDAQTQAMVQAFLNITEFDLPPQRAVEQPRFISYSFPSSFEPHLQSPGQLNVEPGISNDIIKRLETMGHVVKRWESKSYLAGSVCAIFHDLETGAKITGADSRRAAYALAS